jgi:large subunit ribosomal protein L9
MKVLLQKPVDKLGSPGEIVEVADGYARNYLVPRGLAIKAGEGMVRHAESLKRAHGLKLGKEKAEFEVIAQRLIAAGEITISARAGEEGKLFGSVTTADIAEAVTAKTGVAVDRKDVHLSEPIKSIGAHEVRIHLTQDVDPLITVNVEAAE